MYVHAYVHHLFSPFCVVFEFYLLVQASLYSYGIFNRDMSQLAYEVDGYGNGYFMDDANVPSLLSLPYERRLFDVFTEYVLQLPRLGQQCRSAVY